MVFTNPDGYVHTHTSVSVGFDSSCYICKSILHASQVNTLWSFLSFWEKLWIHVLGQNMKKWQPCRLLSLFDLLVLTIRLAEVFVTEDQFHAKWTCCRQSPECPDGHNLRNETLWNWSQCNILYTQGNLSRFQKKNIWLEGTTLFLLWLFILYLYPLTNLWLFKCFVFVRDIRKTKLFNGTFKQTATVITLMLQQAARVSHVMSLTF